MQTAGATTPTDDIFIDMLRNNPLVIQRLFRSPELRATLQDIVNENAAEAAAEHAFRLYVDGDDFKDEDADGGTDVCGGVYDQGDDDDDDEDGDGDDDGDDPKSRRKLKMPSLHKKEKECTLDDIEMFKTSVLEHAEIVHYYDLEALKKKLADTTWYYQATTIELQHRPTKADIQRRLSGVKRKSRAHTKYLKELRALNKKIFIQIVDLLTTNTVMLRTKNESAHKVLHHNMRDAAEALDDCTTASFNRLFLKNSATYRTTMSGDTDALLAVQYLNGLPPILQRVVKGNVDEHKRATHSSVTISATMDP